jgi:succinate dehydrogenase/fumarate reductase-like Fe-S protein
MKTAVFKIWRGDANAGNFADYTTEISEGMVVLDAILDIQAAQATILPADGTARPANAVPVRPKSMACRSSCA